MIAELLLPLQDTAENTAGALAIIAGTITALGVIYVMLRRARRVRPIAWLERQLITYPRQRKREAANERIIKIVDGAVTAAQQPLVESIGRFREENAVQHADVVKQLDSLTKTVHDVSTRVGRLEQPIRQAMVPPPPPPPNRGEPR